MYNDSQGHTARLRTSAEAARDLHLSVQRIKQLAQELGVGRKLGRDWVFTDDDLDTMRRRPDRRRKEQ